jgi:predicted NUDIX family NTP pyrophosphohydrolase
VPRISAGLLMYRIKESALQVLLAHPGGPLFRRKDEGAWSIPKGEIGPDEDLLDTAQREFREETGIQPRGPFVALAPIQQKGGKIVHAWAFEGDCDPAHIKSNTFTMEWPPRSGQQSEFPEIDRAEFFDLETARQKIKPTQWDLVVQVVTLLQAEGRVNSHTNHR